MISHCCSELIRYKLEEAGVIVENVDLGILTCSYNDIDKCEGIIHSVVGDLGLEIITGREEKIVEQIKIAVVELIHDMNNIDSIVRKSDYIVEKLGMSYPYLSRIFSTHESLTLERYIILQKIERIKELVYQDDLTLSEIAFMMDYSSVQYLSNQFKNITGLSVSDFKARELPPKRSIDRLS
jgi:AraC-like DNA-binding protein